MIKGVYTLKLERADGSEVVEKISENVITNAFDFDIFIKSDHEICVGDVYSKAFKEDTKLNHQVFSFNIGDALEGSTIVPQTLDIYEIGLKCNGILFSRTTDPYNISPLLSNVRQGDKLTVKYEIIFSPYRDILTWDFIIPIPDSAPIPFKGEVYMDSDIVKRVLLGKETPTFSLMYTNDAPNGIVVYRNMLTTEYPATLQGTERPTLTVSDTGVFTLKIPTSSVSPYESIKKLYFRDDKGKSVKVSFTRIGTTLRGYKALLAACEYNNTLELDFEAVIK